MSCLFRNLLLQQSLCNRQNSCRAWCVIPEAPGEIHRTRQIISSEESKRAGQPTVLTAKLIMFHGASCRGPEGNRILSGEVICLVCSFDRFIHCGAGARRFGCQELLCNSTK